MARQDLTGTLVGDYVMSERLYGGTYSSVYLGAHRDGGFRRVFKIAELEPDVEDGNAAPSDRINPFRTEALMITGDGVKSVCPDAGALVSWQFEKLFGTRHESLVKVLSFIENAPAPCYAMEFIEGRTLRQLIREGRAVVEGVLELVHCLERLENRGTFGAHGDLKPENVMIGDFGAKLIDPGYFGPLATSCGKAQSCAVTTPAYYPLLVPDDLLAVGIILWEVMLKQHPLAVSDHPGEPQSDRIGEDLYKCVKERQAKGQNYLDALLRPQLPREIRPGISLDLERMLLKGLRLRVREDGKLDRGHGFSSMHELAGELGSLCSPRHLSSV